MTTLKLYPLYHALCNEVAFYTTRLLVPGDGDSYICGHCHNSTMDCFYDMPFSYKDDQPVEVTFDQVKT